MCNCTAANRRPLPSHCYSGRRWRGNRTHSVEMPSEKNRGVTRWETMQRYKTSERFEPDCKMSKSISLTTPYCKVTGRRHRVSPCRSAYFASPWWLLTLDLRRRSRQAALFIPGSWWHLMMWGSRPSLFMIIPNTKRHPNNTKTDQLPISEVIAGLLRPHHNNLRAVWGTSGRLPLPWFAYTPLWPQKQGVYTHL